MERPVPTKNGMHPDVLIALTCKPYRSEVVEAVTIAREQGMKIVALSDSPASPIILEADHGFVVSVDTQQFFPSSVSIIALLETAAVFGGRGRQRRGRRAGRNIPQTSPSAWPLPQGAEMIEPIRSLTAEYYTDPEVFRLESQNLMASTWQFGCHASELAQPGNYATFEIAGESLFAVRGRDGKIRVFYNVCQHRAHHSWSTAPAPNGSSFVPIMRGPMN